MPVEFKPFTVPINISGAVSRLQEIVNNRPLTICLQGRSIQELEDRIEEFKDFNICWGAMNRFDIYQKYILDKIDKKLQVAMDVGEVPYVEAYEKSIRIPRWKDYFRNPNNVLITSREIIENIKQYGNWDMLTEYSDRLIIIEKCREIKVPNSIMLYLMCLAKFHIKKIILFGFDGFGNPKAFKNTPVWDGTELAYEHQNKSLASYYKKDAVLEERRIGYQDERASDLHSNCPTYNDQVIKTLGKFCKDNNLNFPEIVNCSPNSLYTVHRKVTYDQLKGEI